MEQNHPVILFLPEAGIHQYLQTISLIGNAFVQNDHPVYLINCNGILFNRCVMQSSFGNQRMFSQEEKKQLCKNCTKTVQNAASFYDFKIISLADYINQETLEYIENIFPQNISQYEEINYKGCNIGKLAIHDLMIETKILRVSDELTPVALSIYQGHIKSMAKIIEIIENINKSINPFCYITFNPYSQNQAVKHAAEFFTSFFVMISNQHHCGANWQLLEYDNCLFGKNKFNYIDSWQNNLSLFIPSSGIVAAFDDICYRMKESGSHIFSSSRNGNLKQFVDAHHLENKKILLAFTTSQDERIGGDICRREWNENIDSEYAFETQIDWILFLQKFASKNDNIFCIVRIHPREAKDGGSEHLKLYKKHLKEKNANFLVIWPEDAISSYDLMELADICLISSSTTGLECMRLGIPVLSYYSKRAFVNDGYNRVVSDKSQYETVLYEMIEKRYDYRLLLNAAKFYYWRIFMQSFFLGSNIPMHDIPYGKFFPANNDINTILYEMLSTQTPAFEYNYKKLLKDQNILSENDDLTALRKGIFLVIDLLFTTTKKKNKKTLCVRIIRKIKKITGIKLTPKPIIEYPIIFCDNINKFDELVKISNKNPKKIYILQDGIYCYKITKGKHKKILSKAAGRLARMYMETEVDS